MNTKSSSRWRARRYRSSWFQIERSLRQSPRRQFSASRSSGFTLLEVLVVMTLIGILVGIAGPSWLGWQTNRLLSTAQDEAYQAMRQTQLQAIQSHQSWRISFRVKANQVEWVTHPANLTPPDSLWQSLPPQVRLAPETTLKQESNAYFVEFNHKGNVTPPFGRLSLTSIQGDRHRSCVFVSTLLGAMRKAKGEACY